MQVSETLTSFALFFRRCEEEEWLALTNPDTWEDFLISSTWGQEQNLAAYLEALACLKTIPSYQDFRAFADRHFVGGLPTSILAVESLYRSWTTLPNATLSFAGEKGFYESDSAAHMRYLYRQFEVEIASDAKLPADHLSLLLGFLAPLLENASPEDTRTFIDEHLDWLDELHTTITQRAPEAGWLMYITRLLIAYLDSLYQRMSLGQKTPVSKTTEG